MIKTFKVTVSGEDFSFYIEPKYREDIVATLKNFDVLTSVNKRMKMPKPDEPVDRFLTKEQGGCIKCGKPRAINSKSKQYCNRCRRKLKEERN